MLAKIILIPILLVVFFAFSFLCYKKAPPTMAIIVTGFGLSKPKVVIGRGVFVIPIIQRADRLNMRLLRSMLRLRTMVLKTRKVYPFGWILS